MGKDYVSKSVRRRARLGVREQAFLLSCAQLGAVASEPDQDLDWNTLTRRLISDGVAPLAFLRYRSQPSLLPADVFSALKNNYYQNASANHIRLEELKRLGRLLASAQIPLLVLKGAALAASVYPDPAVRFMGDLDVAVPPGAAQTALALLQSEGYTLHGDVTDLNDAATLREKGWHLRLTRQVHGKDVELEFHWPLRENVLVNQVATLDIQGIWTRACPLDPDHNLLQPAPADMLLHLCIHTGIQHRFTDLGLRHYIDLDRIVRHHGNDSVFWRSFLEQAKRAGASDACYFCLDLSRRLLDTLLPAAAMSDLRPARWKTGIFVLTVQTADIINRTDALYDRRRMWWRLLTTDHLFALALGPLRTLFPGKTYLASYYGVPSGWRLAAYALWHPFHVLQRAVRRRLQRRRRRLHSPTVPG